MKTVDLIYNVINHYSETAQWVVMTVSTQQVELRKYPHTLESEVRTKYRWEGDSYLSDSDLEVYFVGEQIKMECSDAK